MKFDPLIVDLSRHLASVHPDTDGFPIISRRQLNGVRETLGVWPMRINQKVGSLGTNTHDRGGCFIMTEFVSSGLCWHRPATLEESALWHSEEVHPITWVNYEDVAQ